MTKIGAAIQATPPVRRCVYLVAAGAGAVVLLAHLGLHVMPSSMHHPSMPWMPGMQKTPEAVPSELHPMRTLFWSWGYWTLMTAAMMFPLVADGADRIAADSLWQRRRSAVVLYLVGYLAVWSAFGVAVISLAQIVWPAGVPATLAVSLLIVAAVWQVTPLRKRALRRCGSSSYVRVRGWQAHRDCLAAGTATGRSCVITCAPAMAVMAVAHSLVLMVAVTALLLTERWRGPNPAQRPGRPFEAICLVAIALIAGLWTSGVNGYPP